MEEEKAGANSELRYIAMELTKLAHKQKKTFSEVADEYVQNVYSLESILKSSPAKKGVFEKLKKRQRA